MLPILVLSVCSEGNFSGNIFSSLPIYGVSFLRYLTIAIIETIRTPGISVDGVSFKSY